MVYGCFLHIRGPFLRCPLTLGIQVCETIPTLGPEVYESYLLWAIWIPRVRECRQYRVRYVGAILPILSVVRHWAIIWGTLEVQVPGPPFVKWIWVRISARAREPPKGTSKEGLGKRPHEQKDPISCGTWNPRNILGKYQKDKGLSRYVHRLLSSWVPQLPPLYYLPGFTLRLAYLRLMKAS